MMFFRLLQKLWWQECALYGHSFCMNYLLYVRTSRGGESVVYDCTFMSMSNRGLLPYSTAEIANGSYFFGLLTPDSPTFLHTNTEYTDVEMWICGNTPLYLRASKSSTVRLFLRGAIGEAAAIWWAVWMFAIRNYVNVRSRRTYST